MTRLFVILIILLTVPAAAHAEAWLQKKRGYYTKLWGSYLFTGEEYNYLGEKQEIGAERPSVDDVWFRDVQIGFYGEFGLAEWLTLVAEVPFKILTEKKNQKPGPLFPDNYIKTTNAGLGDLWLHGRFPLLQRATAMSIQAGFKIPLYTTDPDNDGATFGTGYVDVEGRFIIGRSLYPLSAYIEASVGYVYRGGDFNDEVNFTGEAGYTWRRLFAKLRFEAIENTVPPPDIDGGTVIQPLPGGGGTINDRLIGDQDSYKLLGVLTYSVTNHTQVSGEFWHVLGGANTLAGTTWALALIFLN